MYSLSKEILALEDTFLAIDFREKYTWLQNHSRIAEFFAAWKALKERYIFTNEKLIHPLLMLIYLRFLDYLEDTIENCEDEDFVKLAQNYRSNIKEIMDTLLEHATDNARELLETVESSGNLEQQTPPWSRVFDENGEGSTPES